MFTHHPGVWLGIFSRDQASTYWKHWLPGELLLSSGNMKVLKLHCLLYVIGILCEANTFLNETTCQKKTIFHSYQIICIFPSFKGIKCLLYAHLCVVQKREEGISTSSTILSYVPLRHRLSLKLELSIFWVEGQLATPELVLAPFPSVLALCVITGPGSTFLRRCWDLNSHSHAFILSHLSSPYRVLLMSGRTTLRRRSRGQRLFILFTEIS